MGYSLHDARKRVKALVPDAKAVIELNDALDELAGIEGRISEANTKKNQAEADTQRVVAGLEDASRKLSIANSEVEAAQQKAQQIISEAQNSAAEILAAATNKKGDAANEAAGIIAAAQRDGKRIEDDLRASLQEIENEIARKQDALANVNRELVVAQGALETVKADRDALVRRLTKG